MATRNNGDRGKNGARNDDERRERLAAGLRRQFGTEATIRFLRALPAFRTENDIPDHFKELLDRLDGIESSVATSRRQR
jgi:metal-dependent amidase/aminoacylase/carboxypeptidase family protein